MAAGPLAVRLMLLLAVCYLAGCGQRGPLTLPVRESSPAVVPAAEPDGDEDAQGGADAQETAKNRTDERDPG